MNAIVGERICSSCQRKNSGDARVCWVCGADLTDATVVATTAGPNAPFTFSIAGILLATTLCAVFFSVLMMAPGLAILMAILSVPAMLRTSMAVRRRSNLGVPISTVHKVLWFLSSFAVTTTVITVVLVASVGTFCAVCLGAGTEQAIPVALLIAGVVASGVLFACFKWVRYRWRRDILED